jgi:SAM-dependent methyltransferase
MLMEGREFEAMYRCEAEGSVLLTLFRPEKTSRILEIGSGGGRWGYFFSPRVQAYTGLDLSTEMVRMADEERRRRGMENVRFLCTNMLDYSTDERFDLVYFSGVLQYMDDPTVLECIQKATTLLAPGGTIISRDSVQRTTRVERGGEYPVLYRTIEEYADLFSKEGYAMQYSAVSYPHKRFTVLASRLYALPFCTYHMALAAREVLCFVDTLLGSPAFLKSKALRTRPLEENPQEHRFFKYVRKD